MKQASSTSRKQIGIQPEVARNNDMHAVLPMHDLYVGQQMICQDSGSKCWYPEVLDHLKPFRLQNKMLQSNQCVSLLMVQSNCMWSVNPVKMQSTHRRTVKVELKKSQVTTKSQVQTSKYKRDTNSQAKLDH